MEEKKSSLHQQWRPADQTAPEAQTHPALNQMEMIMCLTQVKTNKAVQSLSLLLP